MAGFMLSPGVQVTEKDFTSIVPAVSTSVGATAGIFKWGPVMDPIRVSSENELVQRFGGPTDIVVNGVTYTNAPSFFSAANFLSYSSNLLVTRAATDGQRNAVAAPTYGIASINVDTVGGAGSGYTSGSVLTISAPAADGGRAATGTITLNGDKISGITITDPGIGYAVGESVTISATIGSGFSIANCTVTKTAARGIAINNYDHYSSIASTTQEVVGTFAAKYPGSLGNSVKVSIADSASFATWAYKGSFNSAPTGDELHVIVLDATGAITGTTNTILEKFEYLSKALNAKDGNGASSYYANVLNTKSSWVYWYDHQVGTSGWGNTVKDNNGVNNVFSKLLVTANATADPNDSTLTLVGTSEAITAAKNGIKVGMSVTGGTILANTKVTAVDLDAGTVTISNATPAVTGAFSNTALTFTVTDTVQLSGGDDDFDYSQADAEISDAFQLYANDELYDISLIIGGKTSPEIINTINAMLGEPSGDNLTRTDCMAFVSPEDPSSRQPFVGSSTALADSIVSFRNNSVSVNSSYVVMDSGYKYQFDQYNEVYRWVPLNGDVAGLCARTDFTDDPWFSPAGYTRGQIKNITKLAYNPNRAARDTLYKAGINCVVTFPGQGTFLYGDKTLLSKPSAFDRINVRRLFIVLEKAIATAAKYQLFEINDQFTRAQFRSMVEPFLRDIQGRRGITDFRVKCDETNNTGQIVETNQFVADIFIKPARSINFISLSFVAARQGVSFEEIGG